MSKKILFPFLLLATVAWMSGCGKSESTPQSQQVYIDSVDERVGDELQAAAEAKVEEPAPAGETPESTATNEETTATNAPSSEEQAATPAPAPVQEQKPAVKKVYANSKDGYVNVRSQPNTQSKILGRLTKGGAGARYVETVGEWYKIRYKDSDAYVKSIYASFDSIAK